MGQIIITTFRRYAAEPVHCYSFPVQKSISMHREFLCVRILLAVPLACSSWCAVRVKRVGHAWAAQHVMEADGWPVLASRGVRLSHTMVRDYVVCVMSRPRLRARATGVWVCDSPSSALCARALECTLASVTVYTLLSISRIPPK